MTDLKKDSIWLSESREYKFRVFTPLHHHSDTIKMSEKMYYCDSFLMVHKATHTHGYESPEIARPFIIMQYTWLNDKNWVEIYEGDILWFKRKVKEFIQVNYDNDWYKCSVRTSPVSTTTTWLKYFLEKYNCYVSWNIYENPELVPEK